MANQKLLSPSSAVVLLSLLLLSNETAAAEINKAPELSQIDGGTAKLQSIRRAKSDELFKRTSVYAFFDPPLTKQCFALGGLFELSKRGMVSFTYPHAIAPNLSLGSTRQAEERLLTFQDDKCRILLFVSKEVRTGDQWLPLHPETSAPATEDDGNSSDAKKGPLTPGQTITLQSGVAITVTTDPNSGKQRIDIHGFDDHGDAYVIQATWFYGDPQPDCLQGQAFFSATPSGLTFVFKSPRGDLPFSIEEEIVSANQTKSIRFVALTCRLTIRVAKEIKQGEVWTRLAPTD